MPSPKLKQSPMQGSLREIALEDGLRVASNALKYAERLVRALASPDTSAADFLLIRHLEAERDLNPCEDTQRALDEAIVVADIVREMRNLGKLDEKSTDKIPRSLMGLGLRTYADCIEAAAEREARTREQAAADYALKRGEDIHTDRCRNCTERATGNAAAMREALERILDIEGYGAPWLEAKCIAQKALEGQQCTPPIAQETAKIEHPGNAAARREAGRKTGAPKK